MIDSAQYDTPGRLTLCYVLCDIQGKFLQKI